MRIKRVFILAGVVAGVIALCVTGLAAATPGHPPVIPPPYPRVSAAAGATTGTNFYAWQQHGFNYSPLCQDYWDHGGSCNPGTGSMYDMAFEITATVTNGGITTPVTFNQLSPLPPTDDYSVPSTYIGSAGCPPAYPVCWSVAADDFVITTTSGVTVTITDIRVLGVYPGGTLSGSSSVNVCFYDDNGGPIPAALPNSTGLCVTNQGLNPTAIAGGPTIYDKYFSVHLRTPQTYPAPAGVARHWLAVQVVDPTYTWYWYNAISSFSWPHSAFVPFLHR